jgi:hypothetical protein
VSIVLSKPFEILDSMKPSEWEEIEEGVNNNVPFDYASPAEESTDGGSSIDEYDSDEREMKKWGSDVWKRLDEDVKESLEKAKAKDEEPKDLKESRKE